jgi:hypothetical protein
MIFVFTILADTLLLVVKIFCHEHAWIHQRPDR